MTCYQSTNLPQGVTTSGRTSYATEAECLQACQEGACCDGTTCSIKPQCQCQCRSNSCCGPDTLTVGGVTGPRCRGGTKAECDARGGTWRPCYGCSGDANLGDNSICQSSDTPQSSRPTFKGVGTTCGNPGIGSITATIQAQDYFTQRRAANTGSSGRVEYEDASVGIVGAFYNGTFALTSASVAGQWDYTFQPQRSGTCVGSIRLLSNGPGWEVRFTYSVVSWVIYPYATACSFEGCQYNYVVDPNDAAFATYMVPGSNQIFRVPRYKELSDMQCQSSGIWQGLGWDPNAGYPISTGPTRTEIWSATSCELFNATPWSKTFQPVFPPTTTVLRQEGTNSLTISLSVSSNPLP